MNIYSINLSSFALLCSAALVGGYGLSWILYAQRNKKFFGSQLHTKVLMWLPIFAIVLGFGRGPSWLGLLITSWLIQQVVREAWRKRSSKPVLVACQAIVVSAGVFVALLIAWSEPAIFFAVWYMSVMSDVAAFFFGNFSGKFHLPSWLNKSKSWDGVIGQLVGAWLGWLGLGLVGVSLPISFAILVGSASAGGDLLNSYAKRQVGIKDWSSSIPGHGGFLDRLSSLSLALVIIAILRFL